MKFAINSLDITHITLGMLLHYLGKFKIYFFPDIQQMWKKIQTNCILCASVLIPLHV